MKTFFDRRDAKTQSAGRNYFFPFVLLLLICASAPLRFNLQAQSTNLITAKLTVITATSNNFNLVGNSDTRTFTNTVTHAPSQIATNHTVSGSASNLYFHLVSSPFSRVQVTGYTNGSNVLYLRGQQGLAMSFSALSNWATISYSTQTFSSGQLIVRTPLAYEVNDVRTNIASQLVTGIGDYAQNKFPTNTPALTNYVDVGPNAQRLENDVITNATIQGGTITNAVGTNLVRINVGHAVITNAVVLGGTLSNATLVNLATASGTLGALSNGILHNTTLSNIAGASGTFGNLTNGIFQSPKLTNATINAVAGYLSDLSGLNLTITNLSAPGAGLDSQRLGASSDATGEKSIAIGKNANTAGYGGICLGYSSSSDGDSSIGIGLGIVGNGLYGIAIGLGASVGIDAESSIAIGTDASVSYSNSIALGVNALVTETAQIRLGTANQHVSIPGDLRAIIITNALFPGSNSLTGSLKMLATNVTGVANGDLLLDVGLERTVHRLSGNTAAANICGIKNGYDGRQLRIIKTNIYDLVFKNASGAAGTAASERIVTGTGGNVTFTNVPEIIDLSYDGAQAVWFLHRPQ